MERMRWMDLIDGGNGYSRDNMYIHGYVCVYVCLAK